MLELSPSLYDDWTALPETSAHASKLSLPPGWGTEWPVAQRGGRRIQGGRPHAEPARCGLQARRQALTHQPCCGAAVGASEGRDP